MQPFLETLGRKLADGGIEYLLVGGCALNVHGYSRMTDDIDVLIRESDADRAATILVAIGYEERRHGNLFSRLIPRDPILPVVDLMYVDAATFGKMLAASVATRHGSLDVRVPCASHLIAMKLHALRYGRESRRSKDALDVLELARIAQIEIRSDSFRDLCLRFGDEAVLRYLLTLAEAAR
jgi:hypothetical protein